MKITHIIFFFLLTILSFQTKANESSLDSLNQQLVKEQSLLRKVDLLNHLFNIQYPTDYNKALLYAEEALDLANKAKMENQNVEGRISESANNLGVAYLLLDKYEESLRFFLVALDEAELIKDSSRISNALYNIGSMYDYKGEEDKGFAYIERAANIDELQGNRKNAASSYSALASYYFDNLDYDQGMIYYNKSFKIAQELEFKSIISVLYSNRALCLKHLKRYEEALVFAEKEISIDEKLKDKNGLEVSYLNIADLYLKMKKYEKAIEYNSKSLDLAKELNSTKNIMLAYSGLADSYKIKGDISQAIEHLQFYTNWKDTLYNQQNKEAIADMETKYETEKKEAENDLLKAKGKLDKTEIERKASQQNFLIIGLLAALFMIVYVVYSLMQKKKSNKLLNVQNEEIVAKNLIIAEKNTNITDSINYAQRIQGAILPEKSVLQSKFDSFIYFLPKDIVSGDFYWVKQIGSKLFFSVVDCTGHGVPGAFMSIIGYNALNRIVEDYKIENTGKILDKLNELVLKSLGEEKDQDFNIRDGMDISICSIDIETNMLQYSGANNSLYLSKNKEVPLTINKAILEGDNALFYELKPNKMPIGGAVNSSNYNSVDIQLSKGDSVFLFSDGFPDQFGGKKGKKFMYKQFKQMLFSIHGKTAVNQEEELNNTFENWIGSHDQLDDVCVLGLNINS